MLESIDEISIGQNLIDQSKVSKSYLLLVSFIKILESKKWQKFDKSVRDILINFEVITYENNFEYNIFTTYTLLDRNFEFNR